MDRDSGGLSTFYSQSVTEDKDNLSVAGYGFLQVSHHTVVVQRYFVTSLMNFEIGEIRTSSSRILGAYRRQISSRMVHLTALSNDGKPTNG